jgi:hypothetical protein
LAGLYVKESRRFGRISADRPSGFDRNVARTPADRAAYNPGREVSRPSGPPLRPLVAPDRVDCLGARDARSSSVPPVSIQRSGRDVEFSKVVFTAGNLLVFGDV